MKSILQTEKECWECGQRYPLHLHHIYHSGQRKISDRNGFVVWLCPRHHNMSDSGVHFNHELDQRLKRACQLKYEETHSHEDFMKLIGRSYL